jgi:hypothetical protein
MKYVLAIIIGTVMAIAMLGVSSVQAGIIFVDDPLPPKKMGSEWVDPHWEDE